MRKNLFLTLALVLASFACATAQNWSVTLGSSEGLPGEQVTLDGVNVTYYKSGIIKANKPIRTLRFAVADTRNGQKPSGNNVTFALSELNVYTADMSKELSYTVKSNADHNTLTKSFDGQGLRALYDGSYNNFFHSMWAESGAVADYHYLELTFEESIERFVIEWGGRPSNHQNNPTVVVLTEGGVTAEPYTDRSSSFSEEKITSIADLAAAKYFTIRGNAPTSYHEYNNQTGEQTTKEPVEGSGPMYVTLGNTYAAEPTIEYLTQLKDAGDGKYYVYFPMQEMYLSGDGVQNQFNNAHNGWQVATNDIEKAAKVTLTPLSNGDFEMSYYCEKGHAEDQDFDYKDIVYIGADPRTGKMKTFSPTNKTALEKNGWCQGFGFVCAFNWSFYEADYQAPTWAKQFELGYIYTDVKNLCDAVKGHEAAEGVALAGYFAEIEKAMTSNKNEEEIKKFIETMKENIGDCILEIADAEYKLMKEDWKDYATNSGTGKTWTEAAYKKYIEAGYNLISEITDADEYYSYINALADYFVNRNSNLEAFLASAGEVAKLPIEFDNLQNATLEQELNVSILNPVNGFRWTLIANHSGNTNGAGYPFTSCAELEVIDNKSGEKIALDAALISSNSNQSGEGTIAGLIDGVTDANKGDREDYDWYWHAIWGAGAHNPNGEVYLDVQFPSGVALNDFTIKFTSRNGQLHNAPKTVVISEYGREHDFGGEVNPFNVKIGAQITDPSQLVDGGLYVIQGNLNVKKAEEPAQPRYYSGTTPFSTDAEIAADAPCVYMFKKAANGWKILSLAKGQYWVEDPAYGTSNLTVYQGKAGDLKIAKSNNIQNAMLIFRDIESTTVKGSFSNADAGVEIPEIDITVSKLVYMDWDGGLAARACYSELPGVLAPGCEALPEDMKVQEAGDYLHFNKTNGEGEWNIYKATMNDQYYAYLKGLVEEFDNLNLVTGMNPGCIAADAATKQQFENAKAAAIVAVENENKANAENVLTTLTNAIEKFSNSERVGFDADAVYRIDCADERFMKESWYTRSIYSGASELAWTVTPDSYDGENYDFLFRIYEVNDEVAAQHRVKVPENEVGKAYIFQNVGNAAYISSDWGYSSRGAIKVIEEIGTCAYNIKQTATGSKWHANGHQSGKAWEGDMVYYEGGLNSPSSWTFVYIGSADDYTLGIENVVEGDEVVSVNYFTPAGMAIAEPVKGINIVVTVYANGVVEAKKVLVK